MNLPTNGITCEIVQHSKSAYDDSEVVTFKLKHGLFVHAEMLRHRLLSFSVQSNRAVPMKKIREQVLKDPYVPVWFGARQKGMVADVEMIHRKTAKAIWKAARYPMCGVHWVLEKMGAHKEFSSRLLNPWQFVHLTVTATELDNLYNLRIDKDAQKDIYVVVKMMREAHQSSTPMTLQKGEWHTPYVARERSDSGVVYKDTDGSVLTIEDAIKCSTARCARSSYNNHGGEKTNVMKDEGLYDRLFNSGIPHASPAEHQAEPLEKPTISLGSPKIKVIMNQEGLTHVGCDGSVWSGNLKGWRQHRQTIPEHVCWNYEG